MPTWSLSPAGMEHRGWGVTAPPPARGHPALPSPLRPRVFRSPQGVGGEFLQEEAPGAPVLKCGPGREEVLHQHLLNERFLRRAGEGTGNRGHVLLSRGLIPRVCGDPEGTASARRNDRVDRQEGTDGSGLQTQHLQERQVPCRRAEGPAGPGGGPRAALSPTPSTPQA